MFFITAIIHPVTNLISASAFLCKNLGFSQKNAREGWVIVENGAVTVRLVLTTDTITTPLNLELQTKELQQTTQELLALNEVSLVAENIQANVFRLENHLICPHHLLITVFKLSDEDALNIIPPLPMCLDWDDEVVECVQVLLKLVPIDFRDLARVKMTEKAEILASQQGLITVEMSHAIEAMAACSPPFQYPALEAALKERGINPENYFMDNVE